MEALTKELTKEERQANIDSVIRYLVDSKREALAEIQEDFKKPEVQAIFKKLREQNSGRQKQTQRNAVRI